MSEAPPIEKLLTVLEGRCQAAGMAFEEMTELAEDDEGYEHFQHHGWRIYHAEGLSEGHIALLNEDDIETCLSCEFESWRALPGYDGIWRESGVIEAELVVERSVSRALKGYHPWMGLLRRVGREPARSSAEQRDLSIPLPPLSDGTRVRLGYASGELRVWRTGSPAVHLLGSDSLLPCIRIDGRAVAGGADARQVLEEVGNAALLEVELRTGVPARLRSHYPFRMMFRDVGDRPAQRLRAPDRIPDPAPFSLFMHARLERGNLSARFLGYYQVLEFYFPRFSIEREAGRVRAELGNQLAYVSEDLLMAVVGRSKASRAGRGVGSEKEQLQATLESIVEPTEVQRLIQGDRDLREFYSAQSPAVVPNRVRVDSASKVLGDVRERLYAIRCRIVHTKDGEEEVFVPFAAEVADLGPDVAVAEFLARRALIAGARPMSE